MRTFSGAVGITRYGGANSTPAVCGKSRIAGRARAAPASTNGMKSHWSCRPHGNGIGRPADRGAFRGGLGRRALRPPACGPIHRQRTRAGRRDCVRRPGGPARADGTGGLPADPRRRGRCRGRLSGGLPGSGAEGPVVDPAGPDLLGHIGCTASQCGRARCAETADRPPQQMGGGRHEEFRSGLVWRRWPTSPAGFGTGDLTARLRPRRLPRRRSNACRGPSGERWCSSTPEGLTHEGLPGGLPLPGWHAPEPARPGAREAPARPEKPWGGLARGCSWCRPGVPVRLGIGLTPPLRHHDQSRDRLRGASGRERGRLGRGDDPGPRGPPYHAAPRSRMRLRSLCCSWPVPPPGPALVDAASWR